MLYLIFRELAKAVISISAPTKVYGRENIEDGNVVFVCNHMSIVDAFINFSVLPSKTHFMAKKELFKNPIMGWVLKRINVFAVDRGKADLKSIRHACNLLGENNNLCIYPQGTRCENAEIDKEQMHNGIGMIALKNNSRVVPLMFDSKPAFFKRNVLYVGKAIDLTAFEGKKAGSETQKLFTEKIADEMNALLEKGRREYK